MNNPSLMAIFLIGCVLLGCQQKKEREMVNDVSMDTSTVVEKDSVEILIERRLKQDCNTTIFAGLSYGDSPKKVESVLKDIKNCTIYVPNGLSIDSVIVRDYDAEYYEGQLATLVLYANEYRLIDSLASLFSKKYGDTKERKWYYSNCEIVISHGKRKVSMPDYTHDYFHQQPWYYDSYRGARTNKQTQEPYFIVITYKNYPLCEKIQLKHNEALENERIKQQKESQKKIEYESELAKRIKEEVPSNI